MREVVDKLVEWLRSSVKEANCKGIVYGLSGGVDSAVIAALSKLAFNDESLAIMMPINSSEEDEKDAKLVIDKFKLNAIKVDLSKTYSIFTDSVEKGDNLMAYANVKPRLRMTTLYYYGQLKNIWLLEQVINQNLLLDILLNTGIVVLILCHLWILQRRKFMNLQDFWVFPIK
ncbi:NAD+ synthetase-like protein [Parvimonas sp. oral taxon 393 str. F0440]|nr:NAD+ synthetase-like protein [Parvimonas sp. oral taxon 393 str. F0440]